MRNEKLKQELADREENFMTTISWDAPGDRTYEVGVDRGVLYPGGDKPGVPWNGLVSVQENVIGGDILPLYYDGQKYFDVVNKDDFQALLSAFTYPQEFEVFDGIVDLVEGFTVTHQPREFFNLSYRTLIGNDTENTAAGYKIHLIYNATAAPTTRLYKSLNNSVELQPFQWTLNSVPPDTDMFVPTAHIIVDSTKNSPEAMTLIEQVLYGTVDTPPVFPTIDALTAILDARKIAIIDNGDGTWTAVGPDNLVYFTDEETFQIDEANGYFLDADTYTISSS